MQRTNYSVSVTEIIAAVQGWDKPACEQRWVDEAGSEQGRGEDKGGEVEDAFGQVCSPCVALHSVSFKDTTGLFCAARLLCGKLCD